MKIEQEFSEWVQAMGSKKPPEVLSSENITMGAMNWIHAESVAAVDTAMKHGIPVSMVLDSTFLAGVQLGYLFREFLAQMEIHQL